MSKLRIPPPKISRRIRVDGWTLPRQRLFIKVLAVTGSVEQAADNAGMSSSSAYRLRLHPDMTAFRSAWKAAMGACATTLRETAFDRAINGVMKPVYDNGMIVGREPVLNDRLLMFLLRHYDKEGQRSPEQVMIDTFDRLVEADDPDPEIVIAPRETAENTSDASGLNTDLSRSIDWNQGEIH